MSEKEIDNQLISQVKSGDKEAFSLLVLKYQAKLMKLLVKHVENPSSISDVAQESFLNAYRALDKFEGRSAFYTWLYRIAINTAKNHAKNRLRRPPDTDIDYKEVELSLSKIYLSDYPSPDLIIHCDQLQQAVISIVNTLPHELRTSIILREMAGLSYERISIIMKVPVGTVRSRIFRARHLVDEHIKPLLSYE